MMIIKYNYFLLQTLKIYLQFDEEIDYMRMNKYGFRDWNAWKLAFKLLSLCTYSLILNMP